MRNLPAVIAVGAGILFAAGSHAQSSETLRIFTAIEVEFGTETNKYYTLQGSADMQAWRDIGEPIFGNGKTVTQTFTARKGAVNFDFYRLNIENSTNVTFAPWSLSGVSIALGDDAGHESFDFTSDTGGAKVEGVESDAFSYAFSKISENEIKADITFLSGKHHVYTFTFASAAQGTFVREEFRGTRLKDRDLGIFRVLGGAPTDPGTTPPPGSTNAIPTEPPVALTGFAFLFHSGESPDRLEFTTALTGLEIEDNVRPDEDNPNKPFTYTYALVSPNAATIVVNLPNNRRDEYDLSFTVGAQGTFVRREFRNDLLNDTDTGTFSPSSLATTPGGSDNPPSEPINPPAGIVGDVFTIRTGATPDVLEILTATTGRETGDSDVNNFAYTYATDGGKAQLVVQLKPTRSDDYELTFTSETGGTFVRKEMRDGAVVDTDTGAFTRVAGHQ